MNHKTMMLLVGSLMVLAGCGGGSGDGGSGGDEDTCAEHFAVVCDFTCAGSGTTAAQVAAALGYTELSPGHGCVLQEGGGGMYTCVDHCTDASGDTDYTFHFTPGGLLVKVVPSTAPPACIEAAGCN